SDRQHLLLAPRKLPAKRLLTGAERRKEIERHGESFRAVPCAASHRDLKILAHRKAREDASPFGRIAHPEERPPARRDSVERPAGESDAAGPWAHQAHGSLEQGR